MPIGIVIGLLIPVVIPALLVWLIRIGAGDEFFLPKWTPPKDPR